MTIAERVRELIPENPPDNILEWCRQVKAQLEAEGVETTEGNIKSVYYRTKDKTGNRSQRRSTLLCSKQSLHMESKKGRNKHTC